MFTFSYFVGLFTVVGLSLALSSLIAAYIVRHIQIGVEGGSSVTDQKPKKKESLGRSRVKLALIGLIVFVIAVSIIRSLMG